MSFGLRLAQCPPACQRTIEPADGALVCPAASALRLVTDHPVDAELVREPADIGPRGTISRGKIGEIDLLADAAPGQARPDCPQGLTIQPTLRQDHRPQLWITGFGRATRFRATSRPDRRRGTAARRDAPHEHLSRARSATGTSRCHRRQPLLWLREAR